MALTTMAANRVLNSINGVAALVEPVEPLMVRLMTVAGDADTPGTELPTGAGAGTGAGYTATEGAVIAFDTAVDASCASTADVLFENLEESVIVGVEIWDSTTPTPLRWQYGTFNAALLIEDGGDLRLAAGAVLSDLAAE